jgi:hypothetical protein
MMTALIAWYQTWMSKVVRDGQCVALFRQFIQDVWQVPAFEGLGVNGGAKDLFHRHNQLPTQARLSTLTAWDPRSPRRPTPGAAVIFKESPTNQWGHVGIFVCDLEPGKMLIIEQSGIAAMAGQQGNMGCRMAVWTNERLLGWLEKK